MKRITDGFILPWLLLLLAIEVSTVSRHERRRYKRSWMSGTKPQGATCRINPCNVPNICNGGRKCELDDSCKHHCICTEDSTHESCVTTFASTVKPVITSPVTSTVTTTKVSCAFNSCNIPNYNISKYDGDASNACSSNYKLRNESERTCQTGMVCHFGVCVDKGDGRGQCECDPGAVGTLCTRKCCRNCGENGVCFLDGLEANCNCHYNYTGPDCSELKPQDGPVEAVEEVTWYLWVVGVCAVVLVILLIVMALVPYIMWKRRVILVMKLVHYFQNYEDDDERLWDAFVSFRSIKRDESFIVHTLRPKLEEELGFKLCLHFRDFIPGATISDNIIRAVKESRRTILLISPEYVQSEWTKLEYEVAQQEMLKRKQRIIPVLLDDISQCKSSMDPTLKNILSTVTYLEWQKDSPDEKKKEKFWKRLQLSLPKKRIDSDTIKISQSESYRKIDDPISSYQIKSNFTNGFVNKALDIDPDYDTIPADEYDTINEREMDDIENTKNKTKSRSDEVTNETRYISILDETTQC